MIKYLQWVGLSLRCVVVRPIIVSENRVKVLLHGSWTKSTTTKLETEYNLHRKYIIEGNPECMLVC